MSQSDFQTVLDELTDAKNSLVQHNGYMPRQWVFGLIPRVPGHMLEENSDLPNLDLEGRFRRSCVLLASRKRCASSTRSVAGTGSGHWNWRKCLGISSCDTYQVCKGTAAYGITRRARHARDADENLFVGDLCFGLSGACGTSPLWAVVVGHPRPLRLPGPSVPWVSLPGPTGVHPDAQAGWHREQSANPCGCAVLVVVDMCCGHRAYTHSSSRIGGDDPDERSKQGVPRQQDLTQQQPPTVSPPQKPTCASTVLVATIETAIKKGSTTTTISSRTRTTDETRYTETTTST